MKQKPLIEIYTWRNGYEARYMDKGLECSGRGMDIPNALKNMNKALKIKLEEFNKNLPEILNLPKKKPVKASKELERDLKILLGDKE